MPSVKNKIKKSPCYRKLARFYWSACSDFVNLWYVCLSEIPGEFGHFVRAKLLRKKFCFCGNSPEIQRNVILKNITFLSVGDNFFCNSFVYLNAAGGIEIGNNVMLGPFVKVFSDNHSFDRLDIPIIEQGFTKKKVFIEDDVWIGAGAIILPGVRICTGAVVGAGSIVTKSVEAYSIVAGNPARVVGLRNKTKSSSKID